MSAKASSRSVEHVDRVVREASEAPHHVHDVEDVTGAVRSTLVARRAGRVRRAAHCGFRRAPMNKRSKASEQDCDGAERCATMSLGPPDRRRETQLEKLSYRS